MYVYSLSKHFKTTIDTMDILVYTLDIHYTYIKRTEALMASTKADRINVQGERNLSMSSSTEPIDRICARCGGLLVPHICTDLQNSPIELDITTRRCVQCGDVIDPVILNNRQNRHGSPIGLSSRSPSRAY